MIHLFTRIAGTLLIATLLTLLVSRLWLGSDVLHDARQAFGGHAALFAEEIAHTPPPERRERARAISKRLGYGITLEPVAPGPSPRAERRAKQVYVIAHVQNTDGQVVLGPLPGGGPDKLGKVVLVALLVTLLISAAAIWPIQRRIRSIEALAKRMSSGDFAARIRRQEGDYFDRVGASLNSLADRIGELLSDERDLLRTVAHEVRAPIARMRFRVEKIQRRSDEEGKKDSTGLVNNLVQVDRLFEELLTYVAFDEFNQDRPKLTLATISVREAVERVVSEVTDTNDEVQVTVSGSSETVIEANLKLFERSVTNLLLNAIAYGGPSIEVQIRQKEGYCIVDVQDSGPGIPELDRPEVVKPFVRLTTKKKHGTGLGLAIVSRIMRLHGGALYIMDAPKGGASIQLVWKTHPELSPRIRSDRGLIVPQRGP